MKIFVIILLIANLGGMANGQTQLDLTSEKIRDYYRLNKNLSESGEVVTIIEGGKSSSPTLKNASFQFEKELDGKINFHYNWIDPEFPMMWNNFSMYSKVDCDSVIFCKNLSDRLITSKTLPLNLAIGSFIGNGGYPISRFIKLMYNQGNGLIEFEKNDTIYFKQDTIIQNVLCNRIFFQTSVKEGKLLPKVKLQKALKFEASMLPIRTDAILRFTEIFIDSVKGRIVRIVSESKSKKVQTWTQANFHPIKKVMIVKQKCN